MTELILATKNSDKIIEIKSVLDNLNFKVLTFRDFENFPETKEDKKTLEGNAEKKAREIWKKFQIPALADDTGLFVDALDGAPGVFSSRFAGENVTYKQNREKLLRLMKNIPLQKRDAIFRTIIVFISQSGEKFSVKGECKGYIGFEEKGKNGFGYDKIFYVKNLDKTFAELTITEKNKISHRGIALKNISKILKKFNKNF